MKNTSAQCEQKRPRIETSRSHRLTVAPKRNGQRFFMDGLLKRAVVYKSKCEYEGLSWEGTRTKYEKIKELILE